MLATINKKYTNEIDMIISQNEDKRIKNVLWKQETNEIKQRNNFIKTKIEKIRNRIVDNKN